MKGEWGKFSFRQVFFLAYTPCAVSPAVLNSTVMESAVTALFTIVRVAIPMDSE